MSPLFPDPSTTLKPLTGMSGVVTGASGGIGRQIAITMAQAGAKQIVVHFATNATAADDTAREVFTAGCQPIVLQADCSTSPGCRRLVDEAFQAIGQPAFWIHAAGADVLTGDAASWDFEQKLRRLIDVDLIGSITIGREFAQRITDLATDESQVTPASLVLIGWDQATEGMEGIGGQMFGPVKAAVDAFAKSLAQEYAPHVRVNTVAPGWIRTAWGESVDAYWDQRAQGQALMKRWGTGHDVASAALYLASPSSGFITGQTLAVNGGFSRRWERNEP
jgi:3-oxoacyl-[acyl-carrier protein] reductase